MFKKKINDTVVSDVTTAAELANKVSSVLSVFTSTVASLNSIVDKAKDNILRKEAEIIAAQNEKTALEQIVINNSNVIEKIEAILK